MVESIAFVKWMRRNFFDIGRGNTGSERIGKQLKRQRGEGMETELMFATSKGCNTSGAEETRKN